MKTKNKIFRYDFFILLILIISIFTVSSALSSDSAFMETVITQAEIETKSSANNIINIAIQETIDEMNISSSDFIIKENSDISSISANTILINEFCSNISNKISNYFNIQYDKIIEIPIGSLFGIEWLSNIGPSIGFNIMPSKEALVNYNTEFNSVGINQSNFKIWIDINTTVRIINPLQKKEIEFNRKVMIVDTVINGVVPENYMNINK